MELKSYQARIIQELKEFIDCTKTSENSAEAYEKYWVSKNIVPASDANIKPYNDTVKDAPHVCLKVPTAGGKTFIGCCSIKAIFDEYKAIQKKCVVWLVPSDSILEQTKNALKNPEHPYRQRINIDFQNRVEVYEKSELLQAQGFSSTSVSENLNIFILSFDSLRTSKKEGRKVYQDNGALQGFVNDIGVDIYSGEEISLIKVMSSFHPVVIVDESHNAVSDLSIEMLNILEPSFVLDLTATPRESSNIISFVTAQELKNENMVKLPVIIQNNTKIEGVIGNALHLRYILELKAHECTKNYGTPYIRPIVLFQAQPKSGEEATTFEKLKQLLIKAGCKEEEIAIKTSDINELKNVNLTSNRCKIKYIITVNALKEGWDCPFAYILASVANRSADVDVTQILGRILRQPYVQRLPDENLNTSYVLTNSSDFFKTVERIAYTLNQNHFTGKDFRAYEVKGEDSIEIKNQDFQSELEFTHSSDNSKLFFDTSNTEGSEDLNKADTSFINFKDNNFDNESTDNQSSVYTEIAPDSTKKILLQSQNAAIQLSQDREVNKNQTHEVPELKQQLKQNEYALKEEFKESALSLRIPQFSIPVKLPPQLNFEGIDENSNTKFYKEKLLIGFELSKEDTKINFSADTELFEIDSSQNQYQQMTIKKITGTELENIKRIICDKNQKQGARLRVARDEVMKIIGSKFPIDDKELAIYIDRILNNFSEEEFEKFASNILLYSKCISEKIDELSDAYCEPKFYDYVEADKIQLNLFYTFPLIQRCVKTTSLAIQKSLYEKEGDMNEFEKKVISEVATLPNVEWWHRNPVYESNGGFEINGVANHFPDFIIKTKSGKIILLETKGDHLIATKKIKLGNTWAQNAGKQFKYFLVYDKLQVEGTKTKDQFLELMKEL